jgi:hypothetical protein
MELKDLQLKSLSIGLLIDQRKLPKARERTTYDDLKYSQLWWYKPVISAIERLRQEDGKLEAILGMRPC